MLGSFLPRHSSISHPPLASFFFFSFLFELAAFIAYLLFERAHREEKFNPGELNFNQELQFPTKARKGVVFFLSPRITFCKLFINQKRKDKLANFVSKGVGHYLQNSTLNSLIRSPSDISGSRNTVGN